MTEQSRQAIGRYAFWISLISAAVLLLAAVGFNFAPNATSRRVLAWVSLAGLVGMVGGGVVYLIYMIVVGWRRRYDPPPEEDITQDKRT